ncbi:MAG: hypothetical protein ABDH32_03845 [Candidatus Caldarchaeales archaeon]
MKVSDDIKDRINKIVEDILNSDLSDQDLQSIADRWIYCVLEIMKENGVEYTEDDLAILRSGFLERLNKIRESLTSNTMEIDE